MELIGGIVLTVLMVFANVSAIVLICRWDEIKTDNLTIFPVVVAVGLLTYMTYDAAFINTVALGHLAIVSMPAVLLLILKGKTLYDNCDLYKAPLLVAKGYVYTIISLWVLARFSHYLIGR